jgi:hypothetical protein
MSQWVTNWRCHRRTEARSSNWASIQHTGTCCIPIQLPSVFIEENLMIRHAHQEILDAVDLERLAAEFISQSNSRKIAFGQGGFKGHKTIWRHWRTLGDGMCLRRLSDSKKGHWAGRQILRLLEERLLHESGESPLGEKRLSDNKKDHWTTMDEQV